MDSPETPVDDLVTVDYDLADLKFGKVNLTNKLKLKHFHKLYLIFLFISLQLIFSKELLTHVWKLSSCAPNLS
jgi:hypothetical protein